MGNAQHNTHVANATEEIIKIVLTDRDGRNTSQIIPPKDSVCVPTPYGRVTVTVYCDSSSQGEASYTDDSNRGFIVKRVGGQLNVVRSVYGDIWREDHGVR